MLCATLLGWAMVAKTDEDAKEDLEETIPLIEAELKSYDITPTIDTTVLLNLPDPDAQTVLRCGENLKALCEKALPDTTLTKEEQEIRLELCGASQDVTEAKQKENC